MLSLYGSRYNLDDYNRMLKAVTVALESLDQCGLTDCRECKNRMVCQDLARVKIFCERRIHEISTQT